MFTFIKNKITSAQWGAIEGFSTGAMIGSDIFSSKQLSIFNIFFSPLGAFLGCFSGTILGFYMGLLSDRITVEKIFADYRETLKLNHVKIYC